MGATEQIARFVVGTTYEDIPSQVVELAKRTALDCLAATLAGCPEPAGQSVTSYVMKLRGPPQAAVVGAGFRASVAEAALANGTIAHAQDYDDCGIKIVHPSSKVLPVALALGEQLRASGREVLTAYILGLEVQGQVALHSEFDIAKSGLSSQIWYGSLGAAVVASKLLRLDVYQTRVAFGIAANLSCGLFANHGTNLSPMAAGNAAHNGVVAALMAQEGVTANPEIIEAKKGFYDTLVGPGQYDADRMVGSLGHPFYIVSPGIGLKKYPSCYHTHRAIDGVLQTMDKHGLAYTDIADVDVGTSKRALRILAFSDPATPYQAKLSLPYCVAAAMVDRKVTLETFTSSKLHDPRIVETRKKVRLSFPDLPIWPGLDAQGPDTVFVGNPVTLRTRDGHSYSARVDTPRGDPAQPLTDEELLAKYEDCARHLLPPEAIQRSGALVLGLEQVTDIRDVMDIVMAPAPATR